MEGTGLKLTPVVVRQLIGSLTYLGLWLALLGLVDSSNSLNRGYNLSIYYTMNTLTMIYHDSNYTIIVHTSNDSSLLLNHQSFIIMTSSLIDLPTKLT